MIELAQRLRELRQGFIDQARVEADAIEKYCTAQAWGEVRSLCHRLAGRAGMLGFPELTDQARALEEAIDAAMPPGDLDGLARNLARRLRSVEA